MIREDFTCYVKVGETVEGNYVTSMCVITSATCMKVQLASAFNIHVVKAM